MSAAELGKAAGERWARARVRLNAKIGRITITQVAGSSHMRAFDNGKCGLANDVVPYCQAFIDAAFAVLGPAGFVTL